MDALSHLKLPELLSDLVDLKIVIGKWRSLPEF